MRDCRTTRLGLAAGCFVGLLAFGAGNAGAQQSTLAGVVTDSNGAPISDVDVGIVALRRLTRTDEHGRFELAKLAPGDAEVSVRRLGYEPRTVVITITALPIDTLRITLTSHPAMLAALSVNATEMRKREMIEDFYRRRARGIGQYIARSDFDARWGGVASDLLRNTPGIRFVRVIGGGKGVRFPNTSITRRDCPPMIWIDGQKAPGMEIDDIVLGDVEGIELYNGPATTPMQFSQASAANSCGTIVVWSRPPLYQAYKRDP
ncbi:MAG: carboxypeptidase-like regulatory domain-containing protein [Gemmatimonadaceae bacterium]